MRKSLKWGILIIAVLLAGLLVLVACGGDDDTPTKTETPTPTPTATPTTVPPTTIPTTTPTATKTATPTPVDGPTWVYEVTYADPAGAEVTEWTFSANAEETFGGVDCWVAGAVFDAKPFRLANPSGAPTTIESIKYWISKDTMDAKKSETNISGVANIKATMSYVYTGGHGQPFSFGDTYSVTQSTELTPPLYETQPLPMNVEVVAVEDVELSALGTMRCYKVEYTLQGQPLYYEWYSAEYDLIVPVKVVDYSKYKASETKEMTSYDPLPAANASVPDLMPTATPTGTPPLGCKSLYWFDNTTTECGQKEFCGAYMYYGLQTFETLAECQAALPPASTSTPEPTETSIVGTSWVYEVNYDCDEVGVQGAQLTLANDTTWTVTVTGFEDVGGVQCYVTDTEVEGNAERRYPYPGGVTPAMDVPVNIFGPTDYRSMEHREMVKELFPLRANAMGGINLEVAREYTYHGRPTELSVGDTWTYESQVELENFLFSEHMTWNAKVAGIESVTVPLGTFDCYKVESTGTGGYNPDSTNYYWWAVDEDFLCPVKYQYNYIFLGTETKELSSYTPAS